MSRVDNVLESLTASKTTAIGVSSLLILLIVLADWVAGVEISLGVLYVIPVAIVGLNMGNRGVLMASLICAGLRLEFYLPGTVAEAMLRFLFGLTTYLCAGLFMTGIMRNRQLSIDHVRQMSLEQALRREAEEQLSLLVESSPAAILTMDGRGVVLAANRAANRLFAIPDGETIEGRTIGEHLPVLADALMLADGTEPFHTSAQCQGRTHDGEIFLANTWFSTYQAPQTSGGIRLAAIVVDSSEEMREREEVTLNQLSRSVYLTTAAVSHEIRNLCGATSLIYSKLKDNSGYQSDADFQRLGELVRGMEHVASFELRSRTQEAPEEVPLSVVLDNLRIVIEPDWREIDGIVVWELPAKIPAVLADRHGLLQAFLNLARNSHRAVENSPLRKLTISVRQEESRVIMRFRDTGPGVANPQHLFQPFQSGAKASGMGLYVSRALLRSYGGELRHEASESGACFTIELQAVAKERRA